MPSNISKHLDKENLHHAYLIEGRREEIIPEILEFLKSIKFKTENNPDFYHLTLDSFKVENARSLKSQTGEMGFSDGKKIFLILINSMALEAQNTMLKLFEEPIENTHFFVVVPDIDSMLATLVSRFYVIRETTENNQKNIKDVENFIKSSLPERINFVKELLAEKEDEKDLSLDSARSKAKIFLNSLESALHDKIFTSEGKAGTDVSFFDEIFKIREFLRQSGSSTKTLMEAIALAIPIQIK